MKQRIVLAVGAGLLFAATVSGLDRAQLSPEAQAFVPDVREAVVTLKNGQTFQGVLLEDTPEKVTLRVQRSATITSSKTMDRKEIASFKKLDVVPAFAGKLLALQPDKDRSLSEEEYRKTLALFDEFLQKCGPAPEAPAVRERRAVFADELAKLRNGMEKIEGEWLTAVRAAVKKFTVYTRLVDALRKRPDFAANAKVKAAYDELVEKRRATARALPGIMQTRIPLLIGEKKFDEAVEETMAFLRFWLQQVIRSEGAAGVVIGEMDFDYIVRMMNRVMEAYRAAGMGREPPEKPPEKGMVYVPGGYFLMGRHDAAPSDPAFPLHIVYVAPFLMDRHEVCNRDYRRFVEHVKATADATVEHPDAPPLKKHEPECWKHANLAGDMQPVTGVDWFDAYAYARWVGKSLPTEAQWEKAARGMDGRAYPWGDTPPSKCSVNFEGGRAMLAAEMARQNPAKPNDPKRVVTIKDKDAAPVEPVVLAAATWDVDQWLPSQVLKAIVGEMFAWDRKYPGPYDTMHMAGNAAEWVLDRYDSQYYGISPVRDPQGPEAARGAPRAPVFRGGSYLSRRDDELATWSRAVASAADPKAQSGCDGRGIPFIGFRCVKNLDVVAEPAPVPAAATK